jgi:1,4-dihydroxy-2-naphthoyl-CoA hydrolase
LQPPRRPARRGLHGGITASAGLPAGQRTATIESKTNFFAAIPKGDTARAVSTPLHRGRTTIVVQTNITRGDGKLAAIVTQTQLVLAAERSED